MKFNPNDGQTPKAAPLPSLEVIRANGNSSLTLRQAIKRLLFEDEYPLYSDTDFRALIEGQTNEQTVTGLKGGDTWKATFMLIEQARERGAIYRVIYDAHPELKVRNMLSSVLKDAGAGRNRGGGGSVPPTPEPEPMAAE